MPNCVFISSSDCYFFVSSRLGASVKLIGGVPMVISHESLRHARVTSWGGDLFSARGTRERERERERDMENYGESSQVA